MQQGQFAPQQCASNPKSCYFVMNTCGIVTLNGTSAVIVNVPTVTANSRVFLSVQNAAPAGMVWSSINAGNSISIQSTNANDTTQKCSWLIN
jgi:hypothetical protein